MWQWGFGQGAVNSFWESLTAPVQDWLSQHPLLLWLAAHPLWLLGTVLLLLFLLSGLLRAVASLTEKLWLGLLRLPILLMQWAWRGSLFLLRRPAAKSGLLGSTELTNPSSDRLTEVLERLETLRQEQDELMQEVKLLLAAKQKNQ